MATRFLFELAGQQHSLSIVGNYFYVLGNGITLPILVWPAWCEACRRFRAAERVPTIAELGEELRELEYFARCSGHIPPDQHVAVWKLPELRVRLPWRAGRVAPAKCLTCGSTAITSIWPGPEVEIPGQGICTAGFDGWLDAVYVADHYFTPEGDPIPSFVPKKPRPFSSAR